MVRPRWQLEATPYGCEANTEIHRCHFPPPPPLPFQRIATPTLSSLLGAGSPRPPLGAANKSPGWARDGPPSKQPYNCEKHANPPTV